ncbi:hypothetical protein WDU94_002120 [Cyamophila willieti]
MVPSTFSSCFTKLILLGSVLSFFKPVESVKPAPSWVKPCRKSDGPVDDCIVKRIAEFMPHILPGLPKYRIPTLDPLEVTSIAVDTGSKQVGLSLEVYDSQIFGLKKADFYKVHLDFDNRTYDLFWRNPRLMNIGHYKMDGKILVLPIKGTGEGNVTMTDVEGIMRFNFDLVPKKDKHYAKITKSTVDFTVGRAYFNFKNLFNGDKNLGKQMNMFMNENYNEVVREFGPAIGDAFNQVFAQIFQNMLDLAPFESVFPDHFNY